MNKRSRIRQRGRKKMFKLFPFLNTITQRKRPSMSTREKESIKKLPLIEKLRIYRAQKP